MGEWTSTRQSILVAFFLCNLMNFILQWMARKSKDETVSLRIRSLRYKIFLWGLLNLLACNLVHTAIILAILSWIILICLSIMHYNNFKQFENKHRAIGDIVFNGLLLIYSIANVATFA